MSEIPDKNENFESTYESTFKVNGYNQDFWCEDGISLTGNPYPTNDSIMYTMSQNENGSLNLSSQFVGSRVPGGMGEDHISLNMNNSNGFWKYNEDKILKEVREYLGSTYKSHYASENSKVQVLDIIEAIGDGVPFCRDNLIKYSSRFGKKNGMSKMDALKIIHYGILLYHFAGFCNETENPYETF
jgi:hypothetical protein